MTVCDFVRAWLGRFGLTYGDVLVASVAVGVVVGLLWLKVMPGGDV